MDSPHLLHLGFLLVALAAPHPNIAMPNVGPAEGTEDSSSGKPIVTVYHCKDCKIRPCSFENFQKIAETPEMIQKNNETHITVCFEQENSYLEGIYGVFWKKDGGGGHSCGTLNSGENGSGDISTEKNICCEAETNKWRHNLPLKCYIQKSGPKHTALPVGIPERIIGNPEFLSSKQSSIGSTVQFVGVLAICVTCYFL